MTLLIKCKSPCLSFVITWNFTQLLDIIWQNTIGWDFELAAHSSCMLKLLFIQTMLKSTEHPQFLKQNKPHILPPVPLSWELWQDKTNGTENKHGLSLLHHCVPVFSFPGLSFPCLLRCSVINVDRNHVRDSAQWEILPLTFMGWGSGSL